MSNPLAAFRKYQHALLVVFGILLMIAWTMDPSRLKGRGEEGDGLPDRGVEKVVSWKGGELNRNQLGQLSVRHQIARIFVDQAAALAIDRKAKITQSPLPRIQNEQDLVHNWLLAQQARKMGVDVSNDAVLAWLADVTQNRLNGKDYQDILAAMTGRGMRVTQDDLFDTLRVELASMQVRGMLNSGIYPGFAPPTPSVAWDLFDRLNRRLEIEFMPVPVANFLDKVEEPRESEIRELYEEGKDRFSRPDSPEPGFKLPRRRALSLVHMNSAKALEEEVGKITEAEVQEYYDAHKDEFRIDGDLDKLLESLGTESKESSDTKTDEPSATTDPESTSPTDPAADPAAEPATDPATTTDASASPEGAAASSDDSASESARPSASPPAEIAETNDPAPEPTYKPVSEVADQIRNILAAPRLSDRIKGALSQVQQAMDTYYEQHFAWETKQDAKARPPEPQAPNIAELAMSLGLQYDMLPMMDAATFLEKHREIAAAMQFDESGQRIQYLIDIAFGDSLQLYRPVKFGTPGAQGEYVLWMTVEAEEQVPDYSDSRTEVVRAWKMSQAVALAKKEAESLAAQARTAQKSLVDQFSAGGKYSVFVPEQEAGISWMTSNSLPIGQGGEVAFSPIPDMQNPGPQTLRDIFRLNVNDYGITINAGESTVYVVHVKGEKTSSEQRRNRYLSPTTREYAYYLGNYERYEIAREQLESLEKELQLKWHVSTNSL